MPLHPRTLPAGFITPCLPSSAPQARSGKERLHEIQHDGFRVIARKTEKRVKLYRRPGNDLTDRFPLIVEALVRPRSLHHRQRGGTCGDDGDRGLRAHPLLAARRWGLYAFDLIDIDGDDLRRDSLAVREATLASLLSGATLGLRFNEHMDEADGSLVFAHACKMGLEGSCRRGAIRSIVRVGRCIGSRTRTRTRI